MMGDNQNLAPPYDNFLDECYAEKSGVKLWIRIWPAPSSAPTPKSGRPWFLWIHGGGYRAGNHYEVPPWTINLFHQRGIHIVSVGYRLAPGASMDDQLDDCEDAWKWCLVNLPEGLKSYGGCDTERYIMGGASSGGGLVTLLGHRWTSPAPRVTIDVNGAADLIFQEGGKTEPEAPSTTWDGKISYEEAEKLAFDYDPSHAISFISLQPDAPRDGEGLRKWWRVDPAAWSYNERASKQADVIKYVKQTQTLMTAPLRLTSKMSKKEREEKLKAYSSVYLLDSEKTYPPTIFLHGTADNAVDVNVSRNMAKKLKAIGVDVLESFPEGIGHNIGKVYIVSRALSVSATDPGVSENWRSWMGRVH